jgi:hypothetical protein
VIEQNKQTCSSCFYWHKYPGKNGQGYCTAPVPKSVAYGWTRTPMDHAANASECNCYADRATVRE